MIWLAGIQGALAQEPGYAIITTTNILSSSTQLMNFVVSEQARGFNVQVVSNTPANQGGWGGGTGETAANNIRVWLQGHYTNANAEVVIDYVLLIGNPTSDVPMKVCYPRSTNEVCLTDFYYADLTGNWDVNSNGYYGEYADYTNGGPDRAYEVSVGRIPCYNSTSDLDGILHKIVAYENASKTNVAWRKKAIIDFGDAGLGETGNQLGPSMIKEPTLDPNGWNTTEFYYCTNPDYSEANVVTDWTNSPRGVVFFYGHGSDDGTIFATYTFMWGSVQLLGVASVSILNDQQPAFAFFSACSLANPFTTNNLSYSLLKNGGVSVVGASSITFSAVPFWAYKWLEGSDTRIVSDYATRIISEKLGGGDALYELKADIAPSTLGQPDMWWMNYLAYNLYGCPDLGIYSVRFAGPAWSF
jgi:hypothetical protein